MKWACLGWCLVAVQDLVLRPLSSGVHSQSMTEVLLEAQTAIGERSLEIVEFFADLLFFSTKR